MTVWRVSLRPYKFQLLQELNSNDRPHHTDYFTDILNSLKEDSLSLNKIFFVEVTCHLTGKLNAHQDAEHVRDSLKVNAFNAVRRTQLYESFFLTSLPLRVTCRLYIVDWLL
jgi:hypothetical protein